MISPPRLVPSIESITPDRESTTRRQSRRIKTDVINSPTWRTKGLPRITRIARMIANTLEKGPESSGGAPLRGGRAFTRRSGSRTEPSLSCIPNHRDRDCALSGSSAQRVHHVVILQYTESNLRAFVIFTARSLRERCEWEAASGL